jgi:hypothetical protein
VNWIRHDIGSVAAIVLGVLSMVAGLASVINHPDESSTGTTVAGLIMILGALSYRSAKKRKRGQVNNTKFRMLVEIAGLIVIAALILLKKDLATVVENDPFPNVLVPLWAFIAYIYVSTRSEIDENGEILTEQSQDSLSRDKAEPRPQTTLSKVLGQSVWVISFIIAFVVARLLVEGFYAERNTQNLSQDEYGAAAASGFSKTLPQRIDEITMLNSVIYLPGGTIVYSYMLDTAGWQSMFVDGLISELEGQTPDELSQLRAYLLTEEGLAEILKDYQYSNWDRFIGDSVIEGVREQLQNNYCTNPGLNELRDLDMKMKYQYSSQSGNYLDSFIATTEDCK